ncbi:MAG: hypothetical protein H6R04_1028 [Burkholderiaceae bacterium]|nr:hypothetical protein [Burkholderiaceae bacterium]
MLIYAFTIFVSAFLLFLVQPIIAKQILPWFGGSAAVWTTCMVFFQCVLFAGYAYADWSSRKLASKRQVIVHGLLLAASLACLPIVAGAGWKPEGADDPSWRILGLLTVTIGLPYFLLSTTGPLVQAWFARGYPLATVYRLYALSNLASLLALLAYPFLIEPWVPTVMQAWIWSGAYLLFALACAASGIRSLRHALPAASAQAFEPVKKTPPPALREQLTWLLFSAMGAFMLLAVTNHITHDLASVPFLWILPLSLYLFTFILCFEGRNWYQRKWFIAPLVLLVAAMAWTVMEVELKAGIPISLAGLFVICMFFHGELAARKPAPEHLTRFYLMMSLGGALGGLAVGIVAVKLFNANYEFALGLVLTLVVAATLVRQLRLAVPLLVLAAGAFGGYYAYANRDYFNAQSTMLMKRNFYGALSVREFHRDQPQMAVRRFVHGVIMHGEQFLAPERLDEATAYFRQQSGIGRAMAALEQPNRRIGIIGLGAGTLATYGRDGDTMRFYDINPDVIDVAQSHFSFLSRSKAKIELVLGDARLAMEREAPQAYDLIVIDAFSGDSIPVHLATNEAMAVYLRHLKPGGVIAFHISNKFLRLAPVLAQLAAHRGLDGMFVTEPANRRDNYSSDWFLMSASPALRRHPAVAPQIEPVEPIAGLGLWTDDFNNLFRILK